MTKRKEPPLLLDRPTAAYQLGISTASLDLLVRAGQLSAVRIGYRVLFLRSVLYEFALDRLDALHERGRRRAGITVSDEEIISGCSPNGTSVN